MRNRRTERFRRSFASLSDEAQQQARQAHQLFRKDRGHPSLRFKRVHSSEVVYAVRFGKGLRALAKLEDDSLVWFWIGTHADYDKLLRSL